MRLCFSKLLGTLIYGKICIYLLRIHYKKGQKKTYVFDNDYAIFSVSLYKHTSHTSHWEIKFQNLAHLEDNSHKKNSNLTEFPDHFTTDFMKK